MGFGILVFGYLLLFNAPFRGIDLPPEVLGYILLLIALTKLGKYEKKLKIGAIVSIPLVLITGSTLILQLVSAAGYRTPDFLFSAFSIAQIGFELLFDLFVLLGIASLANAVELPNLAWKAKRNLVFVGLFYCFSIYANLYLMGIVSPIPGLEPAALGAVQQLAGYVLRFLFVFLFASCYMRICLEGDEEMPYTPNAFERKMQEIFHSRRND